MVRLKLMTLSIALMGMTTASALAESYVTLGASSGTSTITRLGKAPVKKLKVLNLGALRTAEAQLPNGILTLSDRMSLRAKRARDRQRSVSKARRRKHESNSDAPMEEYDSGSIDNGGATIN